MPWFRITEQRSVRVTIDIEAESLEGAREAYEAGNYEDGDETILDSYPVTEMKEIVA